MPKNLSRHYGQGDLHFITFSCYHRQPLLGTPWRRDFFLKTLGTVRDQHSFLLVGYVVMPEHVHLLIGEPPKGTPSTVLMVLKDLAAARLKNRHPKVQHFWQRRFYDFNVHSAKKNS